MSNNNPQKVQLFFRVGKRLLTRMDNLAQQRHRTRAAFINEAIQKMLIRRGRPFRCPVTASEMLEDKKVVMLMVERKFVEAVDELCAKRKMPRTTWVLDACMSNIARYENRHVKSK